MFAFFIYQAPIFENCSCVTENLHHLSNTIAVGGQQGVLIHELRDNSTATNGKCKTGCRNLGVFLMFVGVLVFFIFFLKIPTVLITIR